jgi:hypothetical protein
MMCNEKPDISRNYATQEVIPPLWRKKTICEANNLQKLPDEYAAQDEIPSL